MRLFVLILALFATPLLHAQEETAPPQLVYGVTQGAEVGFREEPNAEVAVRGYFPAHQVLWLIRPDGDWVLGHYKGVSGWVLQDDLITIFTIDPATNLPQ